MLPMRPKTICLILDNPGRDLLGMALLSSMLASHGLDVVVVPMYDQQQYVVKVQPDMVLVNYVRQANRAAIKRYKRLGIRVGVLDTEGGVLRSEYRELLDVVQNSGAKQFIDDYFLWGTRQYAAFQRDLNAPGTRLYLTGCPRFDFYAPQWSHLIPDPEDRPHEYVLLITSFPLNNPRFATPEQEIANMMEASGIDRASAEQMRVSADRVLRETLSLYRHTCERYPKTTFVLRPHPFENDAIYAQEFAGVKNLKLHRTGNVHSWLKHATAVVQLNSSVAFEASLLGKPVVSLEMFQCPELQAEVATACSLNARSEAGYWELLDYLIERKPAPGVEQEAARVTKEVERAVVEWIYKNDGNSSARVAEQLEKILLEIPPLQGSLRWRLAYTMERAWVSVYYVLKCLLKYLPSREARAKRQMKSFGATDFMAVFGKLGRHDFVARDVPLVSGYLPLYRSNAVVVRPAPGTDVSST